MLSIVGGRSESILVVGEQVDGDGAISGEGEAEAHPAIAGPKVQNPRSSVPWHSRQHMLDQIIKTSCSNMPLRTVHSGGVCVRKAKIELFAFAAPAFGRSDVLVVFHELGV